jgi:hypothetical protein
LIAALVGKVAAREQDLRRNDVFEQQIRCVFFHQQALPYRRRGLFVGNLRRPFFKTERAKARRNRARGHQHQLMPRRVQYRQLARDVVQLAAVETAVGMGQRTGAYFENDAFAAFCHVFLLFM